MAKSKLTWEYYSARRGGLSIEKYIATNSIKSLDHLRESLRQKDVQLPEPELLKELFKPAWTGKYPSGAKDSQEEKAQAEKGTSNAKSKKSPSRKKRPKKQAGAEKKSTYLQAAYETGNQDDDSNAEPGA